MLKTYRTIQGDAWDGIAFKIWGNELMKTSLMEANLKYKSYYSFPAGVVLNIPEVKIPAGTNLPPWKR